MTADSAGRFYLGVGIDQRRCAACAACPTLPCADHREAEPCTGAGDCRAGLHEHGCFADRDGSTCNDPDDHADVDCATCETQGPKWCEEHGRLLIDFPPGISNPSKEDA